MIVRKGENVAIGSLITTISGPFNLEDFEVEFCLKDLKGKTLLRKKGDDVIRNDEDNVVAVVLTDDETKALKGLCFAIFELWANGEMVLSNEVEQLTVIG